MLRNRQEGNGKVGATDRAALTGLATAPRFVLLTNVAAVDLPILGDG
jgi:hypothetical protein